MLSLFLDCASTAQDLPTQHDFERWVAAALTHAGREGDCELSIRLVDSDEGRELNAKYRHREAPTNVLSFPCDLPPGVDVPLLGDLVICAPVVAREAAEQDKPVLAHWAHMVVHGTLHLLNFDHENDAEAEIMEGLETRIIVALGFHPPYETVSTND